MVHFYREASLVGELKLSVSAAGRRTGNGIATATACRISNTSESGGTGCGSDRRAATIASENGTKSGTDSGTNQGRINRPVSTNGTGTNTGKDPDNASRIARGAIDTVGIRRTGGTISPAGLRVTDGIAYPVLGVYDIPVAVDLSCCQWRRRKSGDNHQRNQRCVFHISSFWALIRRPLFL